MIRLALAFMFLAAVPVHAGALAESTLLTAAELLEVPDVTDVLVEPGKPVAWVERTGGAYNILLRGDAGPAVRLTSNTDDDGQPIRLIAFLTGPDRLLFASGDAQNPANLPDPTAARLLTVPLAGGAARDAAALFGGSVGDPAVSPDGTRIAFVRGKDLMIADRGGGGVRRLLTARSRLAAPVWSPDGSRIAYVVDRSDAGRGVYSMVGVVDVESRETRFLSPGVGADHNPVWSADGARVAFIRFGYQPRTWRFSDLGDHAPFSVLVADAATGEARSEWRAPHARGSHFSGFAAGEDYDIGVRGNLFWSADGRLVFPYEKTGFRALYALVPGGEPTILTPPDIEVDGAVQSPDRRRILYWSPSAGDRARLDLYLIDGKAPPRRLSGGDRAAIRYGAQFADDTRIVWREAGVRIPERLRVGTLDGGRGGKAETLSTPAPAQARFAMLPGEAETLTLAAPDGAAVHAILYRSRQAPANGRAPIIVHAHGGSRDKAYPVWQSFFGYPPVLRYFLSRGYHVMQVNYRSGTGYGLEFREPASYGAKGNADVDDFIAAARHAAALPFVDPGRIIAYGHSYGGHIVAAALARSDVFAAGVDSAGVGDWVYEMESDSGGPLPLRIPERLEIERTAYASSAVAQLDNWGREPLLLLHGDADRSAAMQQTIELYQQLGRRGKDVDAVIFPGEAHALRLLRNQRRYIGAVEAFFRKHGLTP